jgi:hypothetical protein
MTKRWLLSEVVTAVFLCILVVIFMYPLASDQSDRRLAAGVVWTFCGIALIAYWSKNQREVIGEAEYFFLALGISSIFFGLAVALAPTNLLIDIVILAFLAIIVMSAIVVMAWLRRLLMREVWI